MSWDERNLPRFFSLSPPNPTAFAMETGGGGAPGGEPLTLQPQRRLFVHWPIRNILSCPSVSQAANQNHPLMMITGRRGEEEKEEEVVSKMKTQMVLRTKKPRTPVRKKLVLTSGYHQPSPHRPRPIFIITITNLTKRVAPHSFTRFSHFLWWTVSFLPAITFSFLSFFVCHYWKQTSVVQPGVTSCRCRGKACFFCFLARAGRCGLVSLMRWDDVSHSHARRHLHQVVLPREHFVATVTLKCVLLLSQKRWWQLPQGLALPFQEQRFHLVCGERRRASVKYYNYTKQNNQGFQSSAFH